MKKLISLLLFCAPMALVAQTTQSISLSMQQALAMGVNNRYDLKAAHYNTDIAYNNVAKAKDAWIPNLQATGGVTYNTQLQATQVPAGFPGFPEGGSIALGAKNSTALGFSLTQPIYRPGINTDVRIAQVSAALETEKLHQNTIDVKYCIATAYLNVLLRKLQFKIAQNEEVRFLAYKNLVKGKYQNGAVIENDYLRAKLDYDNAAINTQSASQNYDLAMDYLKNQLNVPEETQLVLSDSIQGISFQNPPENDWNPLANRTEIKQLQFRQSIDSMRLKAIRQIAMPTVSFVGYYGQVFQNNNFYYGEDKWWSPHSYIGLQFSVPITQNIANKKQIKENKLMQAQLAMQTQQTKSDIHYQIQKSTTDLHNAKQNMQAAQNNYDLSQQIYQNQKKQFVIGIFQYSDLLDTEKSLDKAEQNYIKAVYDYMEAKIAFQKAEGVW